MNPYNDYRCDAQIFLEDMTADLAEEFFKALDAGVAEVKVTLDDGFEYVAEITSVDNIRKVA